MQAVRLTSDVVYARHGVGHLAGPARERDMLLDVYEPPAAAGGAPRPAIVLVFGGAFHRGTKEADSFNLGEGFNTSAAEYARRWAARGYVTFSIDYRLIPEDPKPDAIRVLSSPETVGPQRMNQARVAMGLPPATLEMLANGVEAGAMDTDAAVAFIRRNAARWGVDTARIALWGWSAGARNVLNAVFARGTEAAAVIALSPYLHDQDLARNIPAPRNGPPVMLAGAERDLPHIAAQMPPTVRWLRDRLPVVRRLTVLDVDHFYPADAAVQDDQAPQARCTLEEAMTDFLHATIGQAEVGRREGDAPLQAQVLAR
jgi:dienelactone hydrolase